VQNLRATSQSRIPDPHQGIRQKFGFLQRSEQEFKAHRLRQRRSVMEIGAHLGAYKTFQLLRAMVRIRFSLRYQRPEERAWQRSHFEAPPPAISDVRIGAPQDDRSRVTQNGISRLREPGPREQDPPIAHCHSRNRIAAKMTLHKTRTAAEWVQNLCAAALKGLGLPIEYPMRRAR